MADPEEVLRIDRRARAVARTLPREAVESLAREVIRRAATDRADGGPSPEARALVAALTGPDPRAVARVAQALGRQGIGPEDMLRRVAPEAAARLGRLWDEDRLTFAAVTVGAGRLLVLIRSAGEWLARPVDPGAGHILVASAPGESHVLGAEIVAAELRAAGWRVELLLGADHDGILSAARDSATHVVGISSSSDRTGLELARLVLALRVEVPGVRVIVGGGIVTSNPALARRVCADALARSVDDLLRTLGRWRKAG